MIALIGAFNGHTERSRALAQDFVAALAIARIKHGSAADGMEMDEKRLSRALAGAEPLNLWRVANLPPAFWLAFIGLIAVRFGASLIPPEHVELLRGAARLVPRTARFIKAQLAPRSDERLVG